MSDSLHSNIILVSTTIASGACEGNAATPEASPKRVRKPATPAQIARWRGNARQRRVMAQLREKAVAYRASEPEPGMKRKREPEQVPQTGTSLGMLAAFEIEVRSPARSLRFRKDWVEVPLADSAYHVRVALWDFQWLYHVKGIARRGWTCGPQGEIRAALRGAHLVGHHDHGYDYDVGALLLGLRDGESYEQDYPYCLTPGTLRKVEKPRQSRKVA
ncbi:hypothetical protein [Paraburkholderia sp. J76]|uniref:hypothetical protein n=1 Tax=Paraburkholderia sp. J76 TaxID=2805439 RepID=UPI002ABD1F2A|nr:hypothetical protein [Paraburkholderia sp. J76]